MFAATRHSLPGISGGLIPGHIRSVTRRFAKHTSPVYNVVHMTMLLNSPRVLVLRARVLEIIISGAAIGLGLFMWLSMSSANSGINLLASAALLVAGFIVLTFAMRAILKY